MLETSTEGPLAAADFDGEVLALALVDEDAFFFFDDTLESGALDVSGRATVFWTGLKLGTYSEARGSREDLESLVRVPEVALGSLKLGCSDGESELEMGT